MKIQLDINECWSNIRLIRDIEDFASLRKDTKHITLPPTSYPALYIGVWFNDPNGPEGLDWTEIASGNEAIEIIEE